uniref:Carbonic anhydrase n=1 Tax=Arcella intermedia TaxID=1963864 RepID=A0A6B2LH32_9EUKA
MLKSNREWVSTVTEKDPEFFQNLSKGQKPKILFIGCSDSRVPAETLTGCSPGELFVHRNVANLVVNTDSNAQSVIQFAVEVLQVQHIIVCGHYGCGGVHAATKPQDLGPIENWLRNIRDVYRIHYDELKELDDKRVEGTDSDRLRRLIELNVAEQCMNVYKLGIVQKARNQTGYPKITGLIYDIHDGLLKQLPLDLTAFRKSLPNVYKLYEE